MCVCVCCDRMVFKRFLNMWTVKLCYIIVDGAVHAAAAVVVVVVSHDCQHEQQQQEQERDREREFECYNHTNEAKSFQGTQYTFNVCIRMCERVYELLSLQYWVLRRTTYGLLSSSISLGRLLLYEYTHFDKNSRACLPPRHRQRKSYRKKKLQ